MSAAKATVIGAIITSIVALIGIFINNYYNAKLVERNLQREEEQRIAEERRRAEEEAKREEEQRIPEDLRYAERLTVCRFRSSRKNFRGARSMTVY